MDFGDDLQDVHSSAQSVLHRPHIVDFALGPEQDAVEGVLQFILCLLKHAHQFILLTSQYHFLAAESFSLIKVTLFFKPRQHLDHLLVSFDVLALNFKQCLHLLFQVLVLRE